MAIATLCGTAITTSGCVRSRHKSLHVAAKASSFSPFLDGLRVVLDSGAEQGESILPVGLRAVADTTWSAPHASGAVSAA